MIDEINPYSNKGFCLYKKLSCSSAIPSKGKIQKMQTLYFCQLYFCLHWLQPSIPPVFQIAWGLPTWGFKGLKNSIFFCVLLRSSESQFMNLKIIQKDIEKHHDRRLGRAGSMPPPQLVPCVSPPAPLLWLNSTCWAPCLLNAEWMFFWASFPECAFFLGGNLLSFLWLFLEDPKTSTCEKA